MGQGPLLVLFVSTGNAARSLIAEALLNGKNSRAYRARSAGVAPAETIHSETKALLEEAGLETLRLHPKRWQDFYEANELVPVHVIVTLSQEAREVCPLNWPGDPVRVHWTLDDPLGTKRADVREWKFRKCLSTLQARIDDLVRTRPAASAAELWLRLKDIATVV